MPRPERLLVVVGTGTEVGKTWVAARALEAWRADGRRVAARKPVQSYDPSDAGPTDAEALAAATGDDPHDVCPPDRWLPAPLAPPMACDVLGRRAPTVADLVDELRWPPGIDVGVVETVGGVRSPAAADADSADLTHRLRPDAVVLVAHPGLGTINDVRLCAAAVADQRVVVVLNRFDSRDELHRRNRRWLEEVDGLAPVTTADPEWPGRVLDAALGTRPGPPP